MVLSQALREKIAHMSWFHAVDLGEFSTSGRFKQGRPQNTTLYGTFEFLKAMNLEGSSCLDIGTVDGLIAFGLSKLGSSNIHATDTHSRETFLLLHEILDIPTSCIKYRANLQIKDLPLIYKCKTFDLAICAGVFYHMLHPVQAFSDVRKTLKDDGYLIIETPFDATSDLPTLMFNGSSHFLNEPYSYFIPTEQFLVAIAHLTGFQVVATRILKAPSRITLLLKTSSRSTLIKSSAVAPFTKQMLKRDLCDLSFQHAQIESSHVQALDIQGSIYELDERRLIDPDIEKPDFPFHPSQSMTSFGTTAWEEESGNTRKL